MVSGEAVDKDTRKLVKAAKAAGWSVTRSGSGHIRLIGPDGQEVVSSSTPGNNGSVRDLRRALRKAGVL